MNANTTSFATSTPRAHARDTTRVATNSTRLARATTIVEEKRLQPLPLVLAVLPLRQVVHEGRTVAPDA